MGETIYKDQETSFCSREKKQVSTLKREGLERIPLNIQQIGKQPVKKKKEASSPKHRLRVAAIAVEAAQELMNNPMMRRRGGAIFVSRDQIADMQVATKAEEKDQVKEATVKEERKARAAAAAEAAATRKAAAAAVNGDDDSDSGTPDASSDSEAEDED